MTDLASKLAVDGFAVLPDALDNDALKAWSAAVTFLYGNDTLSGTPARGAGARNLLANATIRRLARSALLERIVTSALGAAGFAVRGILFNKTDRANWSVAWHQDCMIPVQKQVDVPHFGPWAWKEGVLHVEAPACVLDRMVTLRLHLDDCFEPHGPLRTIPGSHRHGKLEPHEVEQWAAARAQQICGIARGGIVVMHPLVLHASSKATQLSQRRVVHLEYAVDALPGGLEWHSFLNASSALT